VAEPVHYIPILTTAMSAAFLAALLRRASKRNWLPHLMWWAVGVFFYGLGTAVESTITLHGNSPLLNRTVVIAASILVFIAPIHAELLEPNRPLGRGFFAWRWLPWLTPLINLYAAAFLIGGAIASCIRFALHQYSPGRAIGTGLIATGAMLPAVGGAMTKAGHVEALYIGECAGLALIWIGYEFCTRSPAPQPLAATSS
jgi:hypothetical protein